jgi:LmbE family N-acetylglucosaminyl deacetylase
MNGNRILVLVPHPDDEVVGAALAIRRAAAGGSAITLLDLTHGCPAHAASAARIARRRGEAVNAASALGVARIPDDGLPARALRHSLAAAFRRVLAAIDAHAIDTLWAPAYEGAHPDHDCTNALAFAAARARPGVSAWEFAEYNNAGGVRRANTFPDRRGGEIEIAVDADGEDAKWKAALLGLYPSERFNLRNVGGNGAAREAFRPLPAHDYARPPHAGRLFYARFHWVPIRVKQIDFTTSGEVSAAIGAFLARPA